ncbi:MAG: DUF3127 domain-containing protein [Prevotellaceae bacterium]|jgi:hypothetical protein|nr:DUF3127 domain-containing protein [Prevotellaceae bacterium]
MEITGKIIFELERRSGTSARTGNSWASQSYVLETHDQYPRRMVFDVFGDDKIQQFNIKAGQELTVSFDIDAREYQGRWFNSIRAWRVMPAQAPGVPGAAPVAPQAAAPGVTMPAAGAAQYGQAPAAGVPQPQPQAADGGDDDLPF